LLAFFCDRKGFSDVWRKPSGFGARYKQTLHDVLNVAFATPFSCRKDLRKDVKVKKIKVSADLHSWHFYGASRAAADFGMHFEEGGRRLSVDSGILTRALPGIRNQHAAI